jgi:hypothetical protein
VDPGCVYCRVDPGHPPAGCATARPGAMPAVMSFSSVRGGAAKLYENLFGGWLASVLVAVDQLNANPQVQQVLGAAGLVVDVLRAGGALGA